MNELIIEVNNNTNKTGFGFRVHTEIDNSMEIMDKIKKTLTTKVGQLDLLVIPQKLLKQIAKIMEIEVDFNGKNESFDMDEFGLKAYLKEDFWDDRQFKAVKIIEIVRLLEKNNIPIERLKFLSV